MYVTKLLNAKSLALLFIVVAIALVVLPASCSASHAVYYNKHAIRVYMDGRLDAAKLLANPWIGEGQAERVANAHGIHFSWYEKLQICWAIQAHATAYLAGERVHSNPINLRV